MPNLVGTGLNQVPTNSMLGGLAYQSPDHASIKDLDLKNISQINSEIIGTATDIFVYDTSKDSDGGAWRKTTTHTSWYNETLNTQYRGSRQEFPSVAVIVCESDNVIIYDGDDPDLPMWMSFKSGSGVNWSGTSGTYNSIDGVNGTIVIGNDGGGCREFRFISDEIRVLYTSLGNYKPFGGIQNRNDTLDWNAGETRLIVNASIRDVAVTVLPSAPIDETTGLPRLTIAVATTDGVSLITDNEIVYDTLITSNINKVSFSESGDRLFACIDDQFVLNSVRTSSITADGWSFDNKYHRKDATNSTNSFPWILDTSASASLARKGLRSNYGSPLGLTMLYETPDSIGTGMSTWITTDYNTGWMHGDIKSAFLSDTDATDVTGTELVTNGTFDSDINGWTVEDAALGTIAYSSGRLQVTSTSGGGPRAYQDITTVVGETYVYKAYTSGCPSTDTPLLYVGSTLVVQPPVGYEGWLSHTFTATSTTTRIKVGINAVDSLFFDNISVRKAELDRSTHGHGLQIFGTITKSAVATGSDLVAYSGFTDNGNYLVRPFTPTVTYISGTPKPIEIGTNDACHMGWFNTSNTSAAERMVVSFEGLGTYGTVFNVRLEADHKLAGWVSNNSFTSSSFVKTSDTVNDGIWHHFAWVKEEGVYSLYVDGKLIDTTSYSKDLSYTNNNEAITIGVRNRQKENPFTDGKIALVRFSLSAPSAEQIKKIYEDEKVLFQENAKATLYGSSDAVTTFAYDDDEEVLYVGTSSGRSDFRGLRRINNTTTAVTTAISASNEFIAEQ